MQLSSKVFLLILIVASPFLNSAKAQNLSLDLGNDTVLCTINPYVLNAGSNFDSYLWSDNSTTQAIQVNQTGIYWVEVDSAGIVARDSIELMFSNPPVSSFEVDTACVNADPDFENFSFGNPDTITNYLWDFGNGDSDTVRIPDYTYPNSGNYTVTLTVFNEYGCSDSSQESVYIQPLPNVNIGRSQDTLNIGDTLMVMPILPIDDDVEWAPAQGVSEPFNDTTLLFPNNSVTYTLSYTDSNGCVGSDDLFVLINLFPEALDDLVNVDADQSSTLRPLQNDSDPENGIVSLSIEQGPNHGTTTVIGDSIINYTPQTNYAGYDTILYRICDFGDPPLCDFATIIVLVRNTQPQAGADIAEGENGLPVEINVLQNDNDINSSQTIEISFISNPANGSVENLGDGILEYISDDNFSGVDSFFYLLCDDGVPVLCDTGYVEIEVVLSPINVINSFSPNGDGVLDVFTIEGVRNFPDNKLTIFSRWGDVIFEQSPYDNTWNGGRGFNEEVPEGVYFYQLELNDGSDPQKGYLYLKR